VKKESRLATARSETAAEDTKSAVSDCVTTTRRNTKLVVATLKWSR